MKVKIPSKMESVTNPENVSKIFNTILNTESELDKTKEHFWVIGLNTANKIKIIELLGIGTSNRCTIYPKEVFRTLLHYSCDNFIIAHNHPSETLKPSQDDIKICNHLKEGGSYMDFNLLDSIIICNDNKYFSFRENNMI